MPDPDASVINVRSDCYSISSALERCPCCGCITRVVALYLPAGHDVLETDDDEQTGPGSATSWAPSSCGALLFYVDQLPEAVVVHLQEVCDRYRRALSPATQCEYWANHCEGCDALLEDHDLHCEPEGAFMLAFGGGAPRARWPAFQEPLQAAAGGYSEDSVGCDLPDAG